MTTKLPALTPAKPKKTEEEDVKPNLNIWTEDVKQE